MWRTDTIWFDIAVFMTLVLIGSILLGHFEEYKPKWRRLLKVAMVAGVFVGIVICLVGPGLTVSSLFRSRVRSRFIAGGFRGTGSTVGLESQKTST